MRTHLIWVPVVIWVPVDSARRKRARHLIVARSGDILQANDWVLRVEHKLDDGGPSKRRWRHAHLEDLLSLPADASPDYRRWLNHKNAVVAGNAAIALARLGHSQASERLMGTVRNPVLKSMRMAAVEALGEIEQLSTVALLGELEEQFGFRQGKAGPEHTPDLYTQIIRTLGNHVEADTDIRIQAALRSPAANVRLAALRVWPRHSEQPLPRDVLELCHDVDPRIRREALELTVARRPEEAHEVIHSLLQDHDLTVRLEAIAGLGKLGDEDSKQRLLELLKNHADKIRAAAVTALGETGEFQTMRSAAEDKSWRVRRTVASGLMHDVSPQGLFVARQLIEDRNRDIARQVVRSLDAWPLELAGPVLLAGLNSQRLVIRSAAADALGSRWPAAHDFPSSASPTRRSKAVAELSDRWIKQFGCIAEGEPDTELPGSTSNTKSETIFETLNRLQASTLVERRRAAEQLVRQTRTVTLSKPALDRLAQLIGPETDATVWNGVQMALYDDARPTALRLQRLAIHHEAPSVRLRALQHLGKFGDRRHVPALIHALKDSHQGVVLAAIDALSRRGDWESPLPLLRLLAKRDARIQLAAATALAEQGYEPGFHALERLAYHGDPTIRRGVAEEMGKLGQVGFTVSLIRMLDDRLDVKKAALRSLQQVVHHEDIAQRVNDAELSLDEQMSLWKSWYAHSGRLSVQ